MKGTVTAFNFKILWFSFRKTLISKLFYSANFILITWFI